MARNYSTFPAGPLEPPPQIRPYNRTTPIILVTVYVSLEAGLIYVLYTLLTSPLPPTSRPMLIFLASVLYFTILIVTDSLLSYRFKTSMARHKLDVEMRVRGLLDAVKTEVGFRDEFCRILRMEMERAEQLAKEVEMLREEAATGGKPHLGEDHGKSPDNVTAYTAASRPPRTVTSVTNTSTVDSELERTESLITSITPVINPAHALQRTPLRPISIFNYHTTMPSHMHPHSQSQHGGGALTERPASPTSYQAQVRARILNDFERHYRPMGHPGAGRKADVDAIERIIRGRGKGGGNGRKYA